MSFKVATQESRAPTLEVVSSHDPHGGLGGFLIELVYLFILIVTVTGWTVVGFFVWVPLLIRMTMVLTGVVLYSALVGEKDRVTHAQQGLYFAVRFYLRGFEHFITFYRQRHEGEPQGGLLPSEIRWKEMIVQCVWVIVAWGIIYLSVHSLLSRLAS
jgi:hypothetical protein